MTSAAPAPGGLRPRPAGVAAAPQPAATLAAARPVPADPTAGLRLFIEVERQARKARTLKDLRFVVANEARKLVRARQIFVFERGAAPRLVAISGLAEIDHNAPFVQDMQREIDARSRAHDFSRRQGWSIASPDGHGDLARYPFPHLLWVPFLSPGGEIKGGMLLVREAVWTEPDMAIPDRLGEVFEHALNLLTLAPRRGPLPFLKTLKRRRLLVIAAAGLGVVMLVPVPMTALAPMEVVPSDPFVVAAPIAGVIDRVLVDPGAAVTPGQPIVAFSDTVLRNQLDLAQKEVDVAEARLKKASQQAFDEAAGRAEMRAAMSDLAVKKAEVQFASDMFERTTLKAERGGIAVYSDRQALTARPVEVGQRIMEVADPGRVEIEIELAVEDAVLMRPDAPVKLFLDGDPLHPRDAHVVFSDYQAHVVSGKKMAFRVVAALDASELSPPGIGVRGTAQVYGETTVLGLSLFRRPLSAFRQWIGL